MLKRPHYIAFGLVVLLTLVIANLPSQTTARFKLAIGSLFLPLFGLANSSHHLVGKVSEATLTRRDLLQQIEALQRTNHELRFEVMRAQTSERENARLRQLFGWQQQQRLRLRLGHVVLREPSNWWKALEIDLGSREGMTTNFPVVLDAEGAVVGRITSVRLTRSTVVLLGDPSLRVAALVENEARNTGIIGAADPVDRGYVKLGVLSGNASLKPGQVVKTSGLGGVFPKDLLIGQIVDFESVAYRYATEARVKLAANLEALEEVWVLAP